MEGNQYSLNDQRAVNAVVDDESEILYNNPNAFDLVNYITDAKPNYITDDLDDATDESSNAPSVGLSEISTPTPLQQQQNISIDIQDQFNAVEPSLLIAQQRAGGSVQHHHLLTQQPHQPSPASSSGASTSSKHSPGQHNMYVPTQMAQYSQEPQRHVSTLPDSPPDSGAGSASSPGGSTQNGQPSPFSPESYHNMQNMHEHLLLGQQVVHPTWNSNDTTSSILGQLMTAPATLQPAGIINQRHSSSGTVQTPTNNQRNFNQMMQNNWKQDAGYAQSQISPPHSTVSSHSPYQPQLINSHGGVTMVQNSYDMLHNLEAIQDNMAPARKRHRPSAGETPHSIKPEPTSPRDTDSVMDPSQSNIKFNEFLPHEWATLCDHDGRQLPECPVSMAVVANKGFSYYLCDGSYVCQKKNHTELAVTVSMGNYPTPAYVQTSAGLMPIRGYRMNFYGVRHEQQGSRILMKQSHTNRIPESFAGLDINLPERNTTATFNAKRLHFSETTTFNQRKHGKPNPDQKYFLLVAALEAVDVKDVIHDVCKLASEKVIVRAGNPGQFVDNSEATEDWKQTPQGHTYHPGPVLVAAQQPLGGAALTVGGNLAYTGALIHASDRRVKENIEDLDTNAAMQNVQKLRFVTYRIKEEYAREFGLSEEERYRTGVIAQELDEVLPDAVIKGGDILQVDDSRIFFETAAGLQHLSKIADQINTKVTALDRRQQHFDQIIRRKGMRGSVISIATLPSHDTGITTLSNLSQSLNADLHRIGKSTYQQYNDDEDELLVRRKRRSAQQCGGNCVSEQGFCGNRWMQITVVALVVVMAFCLLMMATLYTLDWYHRNQKSKQLYTMVQSGNFSLAARLDIGEIGHTVQYTPYLPQYVQIPGSEFTPPPLDRCEESVCEQYCCDPQQRYFYELREQLDNKTSDDVYILFKDHSDAAVLGNGFIKRVRRNDVASTVAPSSFGGVKMEFADLGAVVDERYCWGTSCDTFSGNYTLYLPVSGYMPHIPVNLIFSLDDNDGRYVQFCEDSALLTETCRDGDGVKQVDATLLDDGVSMRFELPIGFYRRSIYVFRIGYSAELCAYPPNQVGRSFEQYSLIFYRVCA